MSMTKYTHQPRQFFSKSARGLRLGGYLTIGHAHHVRGGTPGFFDEEPAVLQEVGAER